MKYFIGSHISRKVTFEAFINTFLGICPWPLSIEFDQTQYQIKQCNVKDLFWTQIKIVIVYSLPWNKIVFSEASFNKHAKLTFEYFDTWVTEDVIFNNILLSNKLVQIIYKEQVNDLSSIWFYLKYRQSILHSRRIPFWRLFGVVIMNHYLSLLIYTSHCTNG